VLDILFTGLHIPADCVCNSCGLEFLSDLPIGHALFFPAVIGKNNQKIYGENFNWFHKPFFQSFLNKNHKEIVIEKIVYKEFKEVIILNCIDYLYGHVLLKLFNAQLYLHDYPELGLIIIIPKSFKWLIPEGVAEVWFADIKLSEGREWFENINIFIKNELQRFEKVCLSLAYSHPDFSKVDISKFTRVKKFNLEKFNDTPLRITFISREDRFWICSKTELYFFYALRKLKLIPFTKFYFVFRQNRRISSLYKRIKRKIPGVKYCVVGIGSVGKFSPQIEDKREKTISDKIEIEWCELYSKSQIVVGIHGSNMLLPSALAAGVIEILPESRLGNITEDIAASHSGILLLYLIRFVHEFSTPKNIAANVFAMIDSFEYFILNSSPDKCKRLLNDFPNNFKQ